MKNSFFYLLIALLIGCSLNAQVKIGDNPQTIDPSSVLELESTDKVLVITRVTTAQMNAIAPLQGALAYNTDLQSVHYFDGTQWVNIGASGGGTGGPLTADPIVNTVSTIVITPTATGSNFEVAPNSIRTEQIVDGGINGVDIQDGSIGPGKLQDNSVTEDKLSENSVGAFALDNDNISVSAFLNDVPYLTAGDINVVSSDAGNSIESRPDGAFYNEQPLVDAIGLNTAAILADTDSNPANEIQSLTISGDQLTISGSNTVTIPSGGGGTDDQNLTLTGNVIEIEDGNTIDLTPILGSGGGSIEVADLTTITGVGTTADPFKIEPGTDGQILTTNATGIAWANAAPGSGSTEVADLTTITGVGTTADPFKIEPGGNGQFLTTDTGGNVLWQTVSPGGNQNLGQVLTQGNDGGAALIKNILDPVDPQDAATRAYVDAAVTSGGSLADGTILIGDATNAAQQLALSGDITMDNAGLVTIADDAINSTKIEDFSITAADLNDMGATVNGEILQWDTTQNAGNGGWVVANNSGGHSGTANSIFFAATDGTPTEDNANLFWDPTARLGSGALGIGIATGSLSVISKVTIAEARNGLLAYPLHIQNQAVGDNNSSAAGILFAVEPDNFGKGGLVYERKGAWGVGDFHFLQNTVGDNTIPTLADKVFTIENDGDIVLAGDLIAKNGTGTVGQVLTTTATGTEWAASGGGGGGAALFDANTISGTGVTGDEYTVADDGITTTKILDANVTPIKIEPSTTTGQVLTTTAAGTEWVDLPPSGGAALFDANTISGTGVTGDEYTVADDGITTAKILDANVTPIKIEPATAITPTNVDQMLITDEATGDVIWTPVSGGSGANLSSDNLVQDSGEDRIYDLNGQQLVFSGSGNIGMGLFGGVGNPPVPDDKLDVNGQIRARDGFAASPGTANLPSYGFYTNNDNDTGMFRAAEDQIGFSVGGNEAVRIDNTQNVGIGTVTPAEKLHVVGNIRLDGNLIASNGAGALNQVLTITATGTEWAPAGGLPSGGTGGQILSTDGSGNHSWIDDDDDQEANDVVFNNTTSGLTATQVQDAVDELASNQVIAKGRVTAGGTAGAYTELVAGGLPANAIVQLTVEQNATANPIIIQLSNRTAANFSIQIFEFIAGVPTPTNASWSYTIHNP